MLALLTWRDFGWRLHSRLGVDFRRKGATQRRHVYSAQAVFVTLIKFDVMWEVRLAPHPFPCLSAVPRTAGTVSCFQDGTGALYIGLGLACEGSTS